MEAAEAVGDAASAENPNFIKAKLQVLIDSTTIDFDAWQSLIKEVEQISQNDIRAISQVYDAFLSEFPLCYAYWHRYAYHKLRLCMPDDAVEVHERAVLAATHSVGMWVGYCKFGMKHYLDPADIRRLFKRALSFVGKDYLCHCLWDIYMKFERSQKQWSELAHVYINALKFPTKGLHIYYENFKKLGEMLEEVSAHRNMKMSRQTKRCYGSTNPEESESQDISSVIRELFDEQNAKRADAAVKKYLSAGMQLYQRSSQIDREISCFETSIKTKHFNMKPLDGHELETWHSYLDFVEMQGDFDWAVKLYERCLISCASYSEFWIRYVEFVDSKGGRELANYALGRALSQFLKRVPNFRFYCAMFKEQIGDVSGARSLLLQSNAKLASNFSEDIKRLANMERRMGNTKAACRIYQEAIDMAIEKENLEIVASLYINFAQFKFIASGSMDAAMEVFRKGIEQVPCRSIMKGLVQFVGMHGGAGQMLKLDSTMANAITPGSNVSSALSPEDREDISLLFLEFVDHYGSIQDIRKAWARHSKLFPHKMRNMFFSATAKDRCSGNDSLKLGGSFTALSHDPFPVSLSSGPLRDKPEQSFQIDRGNVAMELEKEQHTVIPEVQEQPMHEKSELPLDIGEPVQEHTAVAQNAEACLDKSKTKITTPISSENLGDNLRSLGLDTPFSDSNPIMLKGSLSPSEITARSRDDGLRDGGDVVDVSSSRDPASLGRSDSPSNPKQTPPSPEKDQHLRVQVMMGTNSKHDEPGCAAYAQNASSVGVPTHHTDASLDCSVKSPVHGENSQSPCGNNPLMLVPTESHTNTQCTSQAQTQIYSSPFQSNEMFRGLQSSEGYAPQTWQYYQQQMHYFQLQHYQQMQAFQPQQQQNNLYFQQQQQMYLQQQQQYYLQQQQLLQQQFLHQQQQLLQQQQPQQQQPQQITASDHQAWMHNLYYQAEDNPKLHEPEQSGPSYPSTSQTHSPSQ